MKKIIFFPFITPLFFAALLFFTPTFVLADISGSPVGQSSSAQSACTGLEQLDSSQTCASGGLSYKKIIGEVVNILSIVLGVLAVIMIIVSGIRFATSGGNATALTSAKNTLVYALIGLLIGVLAEVIVHWVLGTATVLF